MRITDQSLPLIAALEFDRLDREAQLRLLAAFLERPLAHRLA